MAMHIRDRRAHELVKEIAALSGTSQEAAVRAAVEHYAAMLRRRRDGRVEAVLNEGAAIGRSFGLRRGEDPTADLYDDDGLPR